MESLFLRALTNKPIERPPVWMMRQAGRYLPEYRAVKEKHTFLEMCKSSELASEVTLQPIRILDPDAAIIFADILLPAECMGIAIDFNPGPKVLTPIQSRDDINALTLLDPATKLHYVMDTVKTVKRELGSQSFSSGPKAVIGFAGAPWTMACYLIAQGVQKHFQGTQVFAQQDPKAFHLLMEKLTALTVDYLLAQRESGADAVQLFDSWAGNLSLDEYRELALPYNRKIVERIKASGTPIILYTNGSAHLLEGMIETGADCLSVDWRTPLGSAQAYAGPDRAIQGNFDPCHLFGDRQRVITRTRAMLESVDRKSGYIANLGHGILQQTPVENARAFIDTVKSGWA
ncbi:MAG: uroporphyrinogen decarboxylase [Bdellovibrionota bacterium]